VAVGGGCCVRIETRMPQRLLVLLTQKTSVRERTLDGGRREYHRLHSHPSPEEVESHAIASDIYAAGCTAISFAISRRFSIATDSQHLAIRTPKWRIIPSTSSPNPARPGAHNPHRFTLHTLSLLRSSPQLQTHVLLTFLRNSPLSVIRTIHSVLTPTMSRDFLTLLPAELTSHILSFLPFTTLAWTSRVCRAWRNIIDSDHVLQRNLLKSTKI